MGLTVTETYPTASRRPRLGIVGGGQGARFIHAAADSHDAGGTWQVLA